MKIGMAIEELDVQKGGQERSTLEIADLLSARGHDVSVVTGYASFLPAGLRARIINFNMVNPSRVGHFWEFQHRATRCLKNLAPDLIHAVTPIHNADIYQPRGGLIQETYERNLARRKGWRRRIRQWLGPNPRQRALRQVEQDLAWKSPCRFLAVSEYVRRQCLEHLRLPEDRVHTVFNGVDLSRLPAERNPEQRARLRERLNVKEGGWLGLFIATNFRLKGLDTLVDAAVRLRCNYPALFSRFKFLVGGPDKARGYFNRLTALGLEGTFTFAGPVHDLGPVFSASDFLAHPTWYDPCSRVVLEAAACGLPVVTTRYNGAEELIRRYDCGLIMDDPGSADELVRCLIELTREGTLAQLSARATGLRFQVSMDRHVEELVNFYRVVTEQKRIN